MPLLHTLRLHRIFAVFAFVGGFLLLSGCATKLTQPITGYTCCNLRPDYGWVSSTNMLGGAIVPAGESAVIDTVKRDKYAYGMIGGDYVSLRDDTARSKEDMQRWMRQVVVPTDPKLTLATWSPDVQKAVYSAKVVVGMTRPQVLMSLSYPSRNDTKDLNGNTWRYWTTQEDEPVDILFGADGTVSGFSGKPSAVRTVEFKR
ncbi:hypothetical protein CKY39_07990 [Variovorax boronicumulans]|uniref:Uncharacterized protein n=1 Tax=Variovorax boronicumulans TaxID=436515 RepID=A0A250DFP2_9BURK|nr:hypothetical protein [Variovorax boronicumulans]ATA53156.1 hypothetical protein CKY39_07990 [Variovorax boronicumulans]